MGKGRKLTTSRSERYLGSYSYGSGRTTAESESPELGEEDIWSMVDDVADRNEQIVNNSQGDWSPRAFAESNGGLPIRSRLRIPRDDRHVGGLSLAFEGPGMSVAAAAASRIVHQFRGHEGGGGGMASPRGHHMATSAPVNVPDWSKILRVDSTESLHDSDDGFDDRDSEMVPPHEYLRRSRKLGGASVVEGVGRTLKGRDMRRVRDAVWSQTGFDG